jgi:hypothetical protein
LPRLLADSDSAGLVDFVGDITVGHCSDVANTNWQCTSGRNFEHSNKQCHGDVQAYTRKQAECVP